MTASSPSAPATTNTGGDVATADSLTHVNDVMMDPTAKMRKLRLLLFFHQCRPSYTANIMQPGKSRRVTSLT